MKLRSFAVAVGCFLLASSAHADVQSVAIVDLGSPGTPPTSPSIATAISPDGNSIVGTWLVVPTGTSQHGWIAPNATGADVATDLGFPPGVVSAAPMGINDSQFIVGSFRNNSIQRVDGAFYARPGAFAPALIPGLSGQSSAQAVNAGGLVVGYDQSGPGGAPQSFVFTIPASGSGAIPQRIGAFQSPTLIPNQAYAVNGSGTVAGWAVNAAAERQAFVAKTPDGPVSQPVIPGSHWSEARAINAGGDIAGCAAANAGTVGDCSGTIANNSSGIQAFIVRNGTPIALGVPAGFDESFALGISDHGLVVGTAHGSSGSSAFLWYFDNGQLKTIDLTTLLPDHVSFLSLLTATAITDTVLSTTATTETLGATIVGQGLTADSVAHAFRLNVDVVVSVPEPETWVLLLAGLASLGWAGRRRVRATPVTSEGVFMNCPG